MDASSRTSEFQVVIALDFDDGRLFPLTERTSQSLLPICNQPLLRLQLGSLERLGATDILITTPDEYKESVADALSDFTSETMKVELVVIDDFQGTADSLRRIAHRIRKDFIFISSDVIVQYNIGDMVNYHRINAADVTIALAECKIDEPEKKGGPRKVQIDEDDREYIGLCPNGRIMLKAPTLEVEHILKIKKFLVYENENMQIRSDIIDSGVYIFSRWVIDLLLDKPHISNIRTELLPLLIKYQYQTKQFYEKKCPILLTLPIRSQYGIDKWISMKEKAIKIYEQSLITTLESSLPYTIPGTITTTTSSSSITQKGTSPSDVHVPSSQQEETRHHHRRNMELCDYILQELSHRMPSSTLHSQSDIASTTTTLPIIQGSRVSLKISSQKNDDVINNITVSNISESKLLTETSVTNTQSSQYNNNEKDEKDDNNDDEDDDYMKGSSYSHIGDDMIRCYSYICKYTPYGVDGLLQRITTIPTYLNTNRELPMQHGLYAAKVTGYQKKEQCTVASDVLLGEKVTLKQCSVGAKCKIGNKSKLNNCVLMEGVQIGEGCTIQNTVLCKGAIIENTVSMNDCQVSAGTTVHTGTKVKGEILS